MQQNQSNHDHEKQEQMREQDQEPWNLWVQERDQEEAEAEDGERHAATRTAQALIAQGAGRVGTPPKVPLTCNAGTTTHPLVSRHPPPFLYPPTLFEPHPLEKSLWVPLPPILQVHQGGG
eukprot:763294-Hanusia_phi.AAC.5